MGFSFDEILDFEITCEKSGFAEIGRLQIARGLIQGVNLQGAVHKGQGHEWSAKVKLHLPLRPGIFLPDDDLLSIAQHHGFDMRQPGLKPGARSDRGTQFPCYQNFETLACEPFLKMKLHAVQATVVIFFVRHGTLHLRAGMLFERGKILRPGEIIRSSKKSVETTIIATNG
jgi:hypothetical protein